MRKLYLRKPNSVAEINALLKPLNIRYEIIPIEGSYFIESDCNEEQFNSMKELLKELEGSSIEKKTLVF